jgi:hypothetical protein
MKVGIGSLGQYIHTQDDESKIWIVPHMLDSASTTVEVFNVLNEIIEPRLCERDTLDENNILNIYFDSPQKGTAIIKRKGKIWDAAMNNSIELPTNTYPCVLEHEDSSYFYLKTTITEKISMNITEIGVYDITDNLLFYTYMSPLYKPISVNLVIWYRVEKTMR